MTNQVHGSELATKDAEIAALKARVQELSKGNVAALTVEDLAPIKDKYHFFASQYPGSNFKLAPPSDTEDGETITFIPRSDVTTAPITGAVAEVSVIGEFWTTSPEVAAQLDAVNEGIRRMDDQEILACVTAQARG